MNLTTASRSVLEHVAFVLIRIRQEDYPAKISFLEASVGEHVRHILEFYLCLFEGLKSGKINYDLRRRDKRIEKDKDFALKVVHRIIGQIECQEHDSDLILELKYGDVSNHNINLKTNYKRELVYNIEHTIHHLAIMKQAFLRDFNYIELPENFGIASSTVRYLHQGQTD
jgi:hypothetical protein